MRIAKNYNKLEYFRLYLDFWIKIILVIEIPKIIIEKMPNSGTILVPTTGNCF